MMRRVILVAAIMIVLAGCNLQMETPPPPTPDIPSVEFLFPANNSTVLENTDLMIDVVARDETLGISRIEVFLNDQLLRDAPLGEYQIEPVYRIEVNWLAQGVGFHSLAAIAYRPDGTSSREASINIEVVPRDIE